MVLLDVVYNHFGPEGNYLHCYAPQFFTERYQTPWGAAINFDGDDSHWVRRFFIDNALYWLTEYHVDGLRLDAVHAIHDQSRPDILEELAMTVRAQFKPQRHIHLILENDHNQARYLKRDSTAIPRCYTAQWNDDLHHSLHILLTGEKSGYYLDYAEAPIHHLGRCLTEGFSYQGEPSLYRNKVCRGEPSRHLPAAAFVGFLQNHDQIGNRAYGDRLSLGVDTQALRAALVGLLVYCRAAPRRRPATIPPLPLATYRLQFNSAFTFNDARRIVPSLHALGISHCYASPVLKARSGSSHGYDIVDHNALNPELGTSEEFRLFIETLHEFDMGLILDIVPNHMGIGGSDNAWWLDVLENGPASPYAIYFDIDWQPASRILLGKILLPILGDY